MKNSPLINENDKAADNFVMRIINYFISKQIFRQLVKYSIIGISNALIGLGIIYILFNIYHTNYMVSNIIGYLCGLVNSFIWNKKWTFKSSQHYSKEIVPFLVVFGISYSANLLTVILSVELIKIHPNFAQLLGVAAYSSTNFLINRYWTFSRAN